jgi:suppressor of ftsI
MADPVRVLVSRRRLLELGAAVVAGGLGGVVVDRLAGGRRTRELPGIDLTEAPVRSSVNGVLDTTLAARLGPAMVAGQHVTARVYEGSFPGPTLRVRPGDRLRVHLANELPEHTNLHAHGLHVSPEGSSDNIFVHLASGARFDYEYAVPADHPAGLYWYHPHAHGTSNQQVNNGMAGAIVIEGDVDRVPGIAGLAERLLVLQATEFDGNGGVLPTGKQTNDTWLRLVNGALNPTIRMRPGETQRWRILNASSGAFYHLALAGHRFSQIAKDGNTLDAPWARDAILMSPGERVEVLVQAAPAGVYQLRTLLFGQGFQAMRDVALATVVVAGAPMTPSALPATLLPVQDLREVAVDRRREIVFDTMPGPPTTEATHYMVDGKPFDPMRVDQAVKLDATEEWTLRNPTDEWHPFHIHVNPFQVVAMNGAPVSPRCYEDTVNIPPGGSITMRTPVPRFHRPVCLPLPPAVPRRRRHDGRGRSHTIGRFRGHARESWDNRCVLTQSPPEEIAWLSPSSSSPTSRNACSTSWTRNAATTWPRTSRFSSPPPAASALR